MFNFFLSFAGSLPLWFGNCCPTYSVLLPVQNVSWPVLIPAVKCFGFPKSLSDSSRLVVALLSPYFTSMVFLLPLNILYAHLKDHKWTELLEGGEKLATLFLHQKHVFVWAYGLNYWPSVSCLCFFPVEDSLPPATPVGSGNTVNAAYVTHGPDWSEGQRASGVRALWGWQVLKICWTQTVETNKVVS